MTSSKTSRISNTVIVFALTLAGFLATVATAAADSRGRGYHRGGSHHGHYGTRSSYRSYGLYGAVHHGLRGYHGSRYVSGPYGRYQNYTVRGGYRSYGGFHYRTYPSYRFYYPASTVSSPRYPYPVSYAPVADVSAYVTPGSVYDPIYQRGVATQPLDGYYQDIDYGPTSGSAAGQAQPIYIIVQPATPGSQPPVQNAPPVQEPTAPARPSQPIVISGGESGQVFLTVHPANSAVYLDEELLGSGESLAEGREPMVLDSGVHVFEVVHPEYPPQKLVFGMPSAGKLLVEFDLEGDRRGRKARVRSLDEGRVQNP